MVILVILQDKTGKQPGNSSSNQALPGQEDSPLHKERDEPDE